MYSYPRLIHYHEYTEKTPTPQQEKDVLTRQAAWLQSQLDSIQTRLSTIEKHKPVRLIQSRKFSFMKICVCADGEGRYRVPSALFLADVHIFSFSMMWIKHPGDR
jgi:hypothetical protein